MNFPPVRSPNIIPYLVTFTPWYTVVSTKVPEKRIKAYATMPIGIMGSESLAWLD